MSDKKHSRRSEPQLSGHWEICKNYLVLDRQLGCDKDLNPFRVSIMNNKKLCEGLIPKLLDMISTLCLPGSSYEEISQSLDSSLIILDYLLKVSKVKLSKSQLSSFFGELLNLTSLQSFSKQGKINTLALFIDNLLVIITGNRDFRDSSKEIFENFFEFLLKFRALNLKELLEGSISMRESLTFDGTNFENSHFLEYVLLVILSLCKFHDFVSDHEICYKIFDVILSMIHKPEGETCKSYFVLNNLVLALNILFYLGKGLNEKIGIVLRESERLKVLIVNGIQDVVDGDNLEVPFTPMHKSPYVASKLLSILFNLTDSNSEVQPVINSFLVETFEKILKVFNENSKKTSEKGGQKQLLHNILEFVHLRFLQKNKQKVNLPGAEQVLIHPCWFSTSESKIQRLWGKNIDKMFERCDKKRIKESFVRVFKENFQDFEFLQKFNGWVNDLEANDEKKLEIFVSSGVSKEILYIFNENDCETKDILFQIVNSTLKYPNLGDEGEMLKIILLKILQRKPELSEFCEDWLAKLISFHQEKTLADFISFTSQTTQVRIQETLLNSILKAQSLKKSDFCLFKTLITKGFLNILSEVLLRLSESHLNSIQSLWKLTFDVFQEILKKEELIFKNPGILFKKIDTFFRSSLNETTQTKLIESTFKQLKRIVISKDYTFFRTPSGIPLLLTYFSQGTSKKIEKTRTRFEKMLKISTNFNHSIKYGMVQSLLSCIDSNTALILWSNPFKTLSKSMSIHFSISNLTRILTLLRTSKDSSVKLTLLECIHDALALTPERSSNFSFNSNGSLKVFFDSEVFCLQNEFSIVLWFFPDCKSKSVVLNLTCSSDTFLVKTNKEKVVVCINDHCFEVENLVNNSWNLLCLNFKFIKVARMVKNKKLSISLNNSMKHFKDQSRLSFSQKNLMKSLALAGAFQKYSSFIGKISGVYIYSFRLKQPHIDFLFNLAPYECPHFLSSSLKHTGNKQCQDLKSCLLYYCTKDSVNHFPNTQSTVLCDTFSWSSIPQVIQAFTPTRFMVELATSCFSESECLTKCFEIFLRLLLSKTIEITSELSGILTHLMNNNQIDDRNFEIFVMIVMNISDFHAKQMIEASFLKISEFSGKDRLLGSLCRKFKELFVVNRENLYRYCMIIKKTDRIKKFLEDFICPGVENRLTDVISFVMVTLLNSDHFDLIEGFMQIIETIKMNFMNSTLMATVFIHILERVSEDHVKISVIKCLVQEFEQHEQELMRTALFLIDEVLPNSLSFKISQFLLEESLYQKEKHLIIRIGFFEIVGKRLKFCSDPIIFKFLLNILNGNSREIKKIVYDSDLFPEIFFEIPENNELSLIIDEILITIFTEAITFGEFDKLCLYLRENPKLGIFLRLLVKSDLKDIDILFNFLNVLKEFLRNHQVSDINEFTKVLNHLTSPSLLETYAENMTLKELFSKSVKTPKKKLEFSKVKFKCPFIEVIQIFANSISNSSHFCKEILKIFKNLLESSSFRWFNKNRTSTSQERLISENLISIFIFMEFLCIYEESHKKVLNFLTEFMVKTHIFSKLIFFFDKRENKGILEIYDKMPSNHAILSHDSVNEEFLVENFTSNSALSSSEGVKYESFKSYLDSVLVDFSSADNRSLDFLSNPSWQDVYENLQTIIKNFKKSVTFYYRTSIDEKPVINPSTFPQYSKVLTELHENPWMTHLNQSFERLSYLNKRKFEKFCLNLKKMEHFSRNLESSRKVRQVYDKYYRWTLMKNDYPKEKNVILEISQLELPSSNRSSFVSLSTSVHSKQVEKSICRCEIELVKVQGSSFGLFEITDFHIEIKFTALGKENNSNSCLSIPTKSLPRQGYLFWQVENISEIFFKRIVHKHSAIEFILTSGKSYLINFQTEATRNEVVAKLKNWPVPLLKNEKSLLDNLTTDWKSLKVSNFEYLMNLNKLAGRSSNDLSQFPVFPWLIQDYSIFSIFQDDWYRKLDFPIGAQTEDLQKEAKKRFNTCNGTDLKPYHYGSHFSSPAVVTYYLLRIEPFMTQAKEIQGGSFDSPDRLFHDLELSWKSSLSFMGDVKELIPELFYQPFALKNSVPADFGKTQANKHVQDVDLPTWSCNFQDFIKKHRLALESAHVSSELNNWIDLVFGFKQYGKNAVDSFNVFTCTACEDSFKVLCESHPKLAQSYFQQAYHFGMHPACLFKTSKHVKRDEVKRRYFLKNANLNEYKLKKVKNKIEILGQVHAIFLKDSKVLMVKSKEEQFFISKFKRSGAENFLDMKEFLMDHYYKSLDFPDLFSSNAFALFKRKFLVSAFSSTNSLTIHTTKGKILFSCLLHTDLVTVTSASKSEIFSGSADSTIISWNLSESSVTSNHFYYGHSSSIQQLSVISSYCLLLSLSVEGLLLIHDTRSSFPLKSLKTQASVLAGGELGHFALAHCKKVEFFGVNCDKIQEISVTTQAIQLKFNETGDTCLELHKDFLVLRDPTEPSSFKSIPLQSAQDALFDESEEFLFIGRNKAKDLNDRETCGLYVIQQVRKC